MTIQQLKCILAVAEVGSITEAAKQLFKTMDTIYSLFQKVVKEHATD